MHCLRLAALAFAVAFSFSALAQGKPSLPRGLFAENDKECAAAQSGDENGARSISKNGRTIEAFASTCTVRSSKQSGRTFTLATQCQGEGETWRDTITAIVVDKDTMTWTERGETRTLKRCD